MERQDGDHMNVKDFEYIVEIANQGNITRAAERLYITQSALTKFLQKKEQEIGAALFIRQGGELVPTSIGKCCVEKAKKVLEINGTLNEELERELFKKNGEMRLGLSASRYRFVLQSVLPIFYKRYPAANVMINNRSTYDLVRLLQQGDFNVLLASYTKELPDLEYHLVGEEEMVLAVPKGHRLIKQAKQETGQRYPVLHGNDWTNERLIVPSSQLTVTGQYVRYFLKRNDITPANTLNIQGLDNVRLAVAQGLGVAITPSIPLYPDENLAYLSIEQERALRKIVVVTQKEEHGNKQIRNFIQILKKAYHYE